MADKKEDAVKQAIKDAQEAAAKENEQVQETEEAVNEAPKETQETTETPEETDAKASNLFGKDKKKKEKDKSKEKIEELEDKVKRQLAEFENFRNRSEKEKAQMFDMGAKNVLEKILPVVDNFERGFKVVSDEEKTTPFADGMDKIYKQLITTLNDLGVKEIEAEEGTGQCR